MNVLDSIILGIVEGVTEFLPISSTGHLILVSDLLGLVQTDFLKTFEIVIQLGAILAVMWYYRKTIFPLNLLLWKKVATAFVPTAVVGFVFYKIIKAFLIGNTAVVVWSLIIGGIIIIVAEQWFRKKNEKKPPSPLYERVNLAKDISYKNAFFVGLIQSLAVIPGVSRSAATIIGGQALGVSRKNIVEFSFLLAIPTMLAASSYDILKSHTVLSSHDIFLIIVGFCVSFFVALASVKFLLRYIQKHDFTYFGVYRIIIGILCWLILF